MSHKAAKFIRALCRAAGNDPRHVTLMSGGAHGQRRLDAKCGRAIYRKGKQVKVAAMCRKKAHAESEMLASRA